MTTFFKHSTEDPPQPSTWRIYRNEFDVEIHMWCPNGHFMKMAAQNIFGLIPSVQMNLPFRCVGCGFGDMVWLTSNGKAYSDPDEERSDDEGRQESSQQS